jgi:riboflavin synthase
MLGVIRSKISDLIYSIESGFSIVETIGITGFEPTDNGQSLKVSLATVMNDLVKNNVNLDITVNYNNNIYGTIS